MRWWTSVAQADPVVDSAIGSADDASLAGAALMRMHAGGRAALLDLASRTAVDADVLSQALRGVDHSTALRAWTHTGRDEFDVIRGEADEAALRVVDTLTSAGIPWPVALRRAASGYGLPPGQADVFASQMSAPVMAEPVVDDAGDVALGSWASQQVSKSQPISKADEDFFFVERNGRRYRQRVLRDDEGQFARQGERGEQRQEQQMPEAEFARKVKRGRMSLSDVKRLSVEQRKQYDEQRGEKREKRQKRRHRQQRAQQAKDQRQAAVAAGMRQLEAQQRQERAERAARVAAELAAPRVQRQEQTQRLDVAEAKMSRAELRAKERVKAKAHRKVLERAQARKARRVENKMITRTDPPPVGGSEWLVDALTEKWPLGFPADTAEQTEALEWFVGQLSRYVQAARDASWTTNGEREWGLYGDVHGYDRPAEHAPSSADYPLMMALDTRGLEALHRATQIYGVGDKIPIASFALLDSDVIDTADVPGVESHGNKDKAIRGAPIRFVTRSPQLPLIEHTSDSGSTLTYYVPVMGLTGFSSRSSRAQTAHVLPDLDQHIVVDANLDNWANIFWGVETKMRAAVRPDADGWMIEPTYSAFDSKLMTALANHQQQYDGSLLLDPTSQSMEELYQVCVDDLRDGIAEEGGDVANIQSHGWHSDMMRRRVHESFKETIARQVGMAVAELDIDPASDEADALWHAFSDMHEVLQDILETAAGDGFDPFEVTEFTAMVSWHCPQFDQMQLMKDVSYGYDSAVTKTYMSSAGSLTDLLAHYNSDAYNVATSTGLDSASGELSHDSGFSDEELRSLSAHLRAATPSTQHDWIATIMNEISNSGAREAPGG